MSVAPLRLAFVGSTSVGKSTLCRHFAAEYKLPMIHEIARVILSEWETNFASLHADLAKTTAYQEAIFRRQIQVELAQQAGYVSDRAFDNLAYAADSADAYSKIVQYEGFPAYLEHLKSVLVFFVRPHKSIIKEDGIRHGADWESIVRIDSMIKMLLRTFNVRYFEINSPILLDRIELVRNVVSLKLGV